MKRCFTPIHCELHAKCYLSQVDFRKGYFTPINVGEFCDHFIPLDVTPEEDEAWGRLSDKTGDLE